LAGTFCKLETESQTHTHTHTHTQRERERERERDEAYPKMIIDRNKHHKRPITTIDNAYYSKSIICMSLYGDLKADPQMSQKYCALFSIYIVLLQALFYSKCSKLLI
jgi:hypothetical protein